MSTVLSSPSLPATTLSGSGSLRRGALLASLLTPLSLSVLGYHPYAEDGGLYLAGVKYLLNTALFPREREFVTAPLHYSLFAPAVAGLVRHSGLSFDNVVFIVFLLCLWATLFASSLVAQLCFRVQSEQVGATLLVGLWLGLPVAGTSLMMVDPYLTARSFSTPLVLLAVAGTLRALTGLRHAHSRASLRRSAFFAAASLAAAAAFHPLMAGYGAAFLFGALWMELGIPGKDFVRAGVLVVAAVLLAACVQVLVPAAPPGFARVALTRSYWYLSEWQWFEVVGIVAPLLLLFVAAQVQTMPGMRLFARASVAICCAAIAVSLSFARVGSQPLGVAHLQPLRVFQLAYFALLLSLGGFLARYALRGRPMRWALAGLLLSASIFYPSRSTFAHSSHLELPFFASANAVNGHSWVGAFRWVRLNTPIDTLVALDADYITEPDEDAQAFRAIAERSSLPDFSKDGGETAVNPKLTGAWTRGVDAQQDLSRRDDSYRHRVLGPLGVTWMVVRSRAQTADSCPYDNGIVKVCRLFP